MREIFCFNDQEKKIEMDLRQKSQIMNDNYITSSQCRNISLQRDNRYFWCRVLAISSACW